MEGADAMRLILKERPYMKILAVTGMMVGAVQIIALQAGTQAILGKPIRPNELRAAIFHLIDPADRWLATLAAGN